MAPSDAHKTDKTSKLRHDNLRRLSRAFFFFSSRYSVECAPVHADLCIRCPHIKIRAIFPVVLHALDFCLIAGCRSHVLFF